MQYVYVERESLLEALDSEHWAESPEQLLERLETALEEGTLSIDEVTEYLHDLSTTHHTKLNVTE